MQNLCFISRERNSFNKTNTRVLLKLIRNFCTCFDPISCPQCNYRTAKHIVNSMYSVGIDSKGLGKSCIWNWHKEITVIWYLPRPPCLVFENFWPNTFTSKHIPIVKNEEEGKSSSVFFFFFSYIFPFTRFFLKFFFNCCLSFYDHISIPLHAQLEKHLYYLVEY